MLSMWCLVFFETLKIYTSKVITFCRVLTTQVVDAISFLQLLQEYTNYPQ
jgi:hypothetical protein